MLDICCISMLVISLMLFFLPAIWRYFMRRRRGKQGGEKTVYRDRQGKNVVDVSIPGSDITVKKQAFRESALQKKRSGRFMYSSVSYSTGDRWGRMEVTEKDGERTVHRYGNLARNKRKEKKDDDFVDVDARDADRSPFLT